MAETLRFSSVEVAACFASLGPSFARPAAAATDGRVSLQSDVSFVSRLAGFLVFPPSLVRFSLAVFPGRRDKSSRQLSA